LGGIPQLREVTERLQVLKRGSGFSTPTDRKRWPTPVILFQMRDERLRYELTTDAVCQTNPDASA